MDGDLCAVPPSNSWLQLGILRMRALILLPDSDVYQNYNSPPMNYEVVARSFLSCGCMIAAFPHSSSHFVVSYHLKEKKWSDSLQ